MMMNMIEAGILLLLTFAASFFSSAHAYQFVVGGRQGWVLNPSENYNHWAERMRFQVNDTLLFTYNAASDSVVVLNKNSYDTCDASNPIQRFSDGNTIFTFDRSGPFYFITGNKSNCDQGQKMVIVVLAIRNNNRPSPPSSSSSPPQASASIPSPSPASASGPTASSPTPSPESHSSGPSPASSPESTGLASSPRSGGGPGIGNGSPTAGGNNPADGITTPEGGGSRPSSWGVSPCMPSFVLLLVAWLISIGCL